MLRDVFYYGKKPNAHPREKFATNLADARQQTTTEHFWIINEYCDYTNFDWDFDFDFLADEDVWAEEHNNVWPSPYQKDSGTWLCSEQDSQVIIYRADVEPIPLKNAISNNWKIIEAIDTNTFDFKWHPDPTEDPYIYVFGNQWYSGTIMPTVEYHVPGATDRKYVTDKIAQLLPMPELFNTIRETVDFDYSWRPDPTSPPYIYVFGNTQYPATVMPTIEFHVEGATERKYIENILPKLKPQQNRFNILEIIDRTKFDFSWVPDPTSPPYIYVFGNTQYPGTIMPTVEYTVEGATERKYIDDIVAHMLPMQSLFNTIHETLDFDYSWRPDPTSPPYIYVFGNTQYPGTIMPTIEFHVEGATERKYIDDIVPTLAHQPHNFQLLEDIDTSTFDFSWVPDPTAPPYIYAWGNQWNKPEDKISVQYVVEGATEYKYMEQRATRKACTDNWQTPGYVIQSSFDYSWEPNPNDPPYIYVFGTTHQKTGGPRYVVEGATDIKYMGILKAQVIPWQFKNWRVPRNVDQTKFDFSWHPDDTEPNYIYQFPSQWSRTGGPKFMMPDATEVKYVDSPVAIAKKDMTHWSVPDNLDVSEFDFSWHPDIEDKPYIYQFGTQWQKTNGPIFTAPGCTEESEIKYIDILKAKSLPTATNWVTHEDVVDFDYSWHPDSTEQPYIYQWGNKHYGSELKPTIEYIVPGATEIKHMSQDVKLKVSDKWVENYAIDKTKFDMSWRPDPTSPPYIYAWGNKHIGAELKPTLEYHTEGASEYKFIPEVLELLPEFDKWKEIQPIDKSKFDFTWRPDPTSPPYIYVWGNKHVAGELMSTIEYHVSDATEKKYMEELVDVLPEMYKWVVIQDIDREVFDFTWRPDPTSPPYIYVWGNKYISAELLPTVEYHSEGATERKYMDNLVAVVPEIEKWKELQQIDKTKFDMSWRPDPREPAYIYTWGNKHIDAELKPTLEYYCEGATERKYMGNVEVLPELDKWVEVQSVDRTKFDLTWRPDPREPAYIYVWGNKHISGELKSTIEYHSEGAIERKYMGDADVIPDDNWNILLPVDNSFDFTWRPDPREPAYIYVWGNQHNRGEIEPTVVYTVPGATETKFMSEPITVLPDYKNWTETQPINRTKFDFSWRPNPSSPPYIYVWGNKYIPAELKPTLTYTVPGATEYKYFQEPIEVLPESERWNVIQEPDNFDFTWRPDPREPAYIYVWGNKHISGELKSTIEYHCPNAIERKYVGNIDVKPEWDRYQILIPVDKTSFDFTWRPDPREPAYIYVWGNQSNSAEKEPTIEYHCEGATERKYITDTFAKTLPVVENWKILIPVDNFDFSWRPDPHSPPYIYVFGNQWHDAMTEPTLEYHVDGATDRKFVTDIIPNVTRTQENWQTLIPVESFDYSWRPNPHSAPYIYVFGNQWHNSIKEPTVEYHVPGATDKKYIDDIHAIAKSTATESHWTRLIPIESFDYSWRPDPHSPPFIYVFGNKWNDATTEPSIEYHVQGANEYKYVSDPIAVPQANLSFWSINNNDDLETFDFTWRPNPHSPAQIYQWADNGPRYTMPDATEVVFMERTVEIRKAVVNRYKIKTTIEDLIAEHIDEVFWAINPDLNYDKFDFSWRPNEENFRHINVFGNEYSKNTQTYYINGPLYNMGHREFNYVEEQSVKVDSNLSMFFIDRSNSESAQRFAELKVRYPHLQKTRYLNSWVDTINRCVAKSNTNLFWVLNSELDYTEFEFDFYPSPWQQRMIHVFGTQWSHWGTTFMVNKEAFPEDTKYVKIIEHLNMLNFVKSKKAKAVNVLYDIVYIDHGNMNPADYENKTVIKYENSYLKTFKKLLEQLPTKNEHYIWIASSVCDYSNFDFTYICDPYAREQLHVFPSDKQKFGDTFLVNVNKLRSLVNEMLTLEDYGKINYNQHQRANRLPAPKIITMGDTHCESIQQDFDFPYAIFTTNDNANLIVNDVEPMSLWSPNTKNIIITASGGTRIVVPKEAKSYITEELYDYPYITKTKNIAKSKPLDIVFLSNGETGADENYEHLLKVTKGLPNRVVRVDGINGRVAAYHAAAEASETPWMFTVFAKLRVDNKFDWDWQPDRLQIPKHYIFNATNPVNGLIYGHQAMIAYNKNITLSNNGRGLDFTLDDEHEVVEMNSGVAMFNTDEWSTWRTSFREAIKLRADNSQASKDRLNIWLTVGEGSFAQYSIDGAKDAVEYYEQVNGDIDKLRLSYDWPWLQEYFNNKYN